MTQMQLLRVEYLLQLTWVGSVRPTITLKCRLSQGVQLYPTQHERFENPAALHRTPADIPICRSLPVPQTASAILVLHI